MCTLEEWLHYMGTPNRSETILSVGAGGVCRCQWDRGDACFLMVGTICSQEEEEDPCGGTDRIPSTTPGAEPPRGAKDSGSARSHSTHLETSSQKRP